MAGLRDDQIRRYARHVLLPDVGGSGQARLLAATVTVDVGPESAAEVVAVVYLAAAGVGRIVLSGAPEDPVTAPEVAAGIAYGAADVGRPRIAAIADRVAAINPDVTIAPAHDAVPLSAVRPLARVGDWLGDPGVELPSGVSGELPDALIEGGLRAVQTLNEILSDEPA